MKGLSALRKTRGRIRSEIILMLRRQYDMIVGDIDARVRQGLALHGI